MLQLFHAGDGIVFEEKFFHDNVRSVKVVFNGSVDVFQSTAAANAPQEENNDSIIFRTRALDNLYDLKAREAN